MRSRLVRGLGCSCTEITEAALLGCMLLRSSWFDMVLQLEVGCIRRSFRSYNNLPIIRGYKGGWGYKIALSQHRFTVLGYWEYWPTKEAAISIDGSLASFYLDL